MWQIEYTDEFEKWWNELSQEAQKDVASVVGLLEEWGVRLDYPYSSKIKGARTGVLRELRIQSSGRHLRVMYAFDPRRTALLLLGGDKTGEKNWYEKYVVLADRLYEEHLEILRREGAVSDGEEVS